MVVLVATLDTENVKGLVKEMNLENLETIVVNQSRQGRVTSQLLEDGKTKILYSDRLGLSASRNDALNLAPYTAICQIADDDMVFVEDYEKLVDQAYQEFPDADMIVFYVDQERSELSKKPLKKGKMNHITAMKTSSVQISFKKSSLVDRGITFDERFGIGAPYTFGEENILLFDALRKGLKIYSYPEKIATLRDRESHWDRTPTPSLCQNRGAVFKRMSPKWYWLLIIQFAIRKRQMMRPEISILANLKYMFQGAREFQKSRT